jgi:hypothetical protein
LKFQKKKRLNSFLDRKQSFSWFNSETAKKSKSYKRFKYPNLQQLLAVKKKILQDCKKGFEANVEETSKSVNHSSQQSISQDLERMLPVRCEDLEQMLPVKKTISMDKQVSTPPYVPVISVKLLTPKSKNVLEQEQKLYCQIL